MHTHIFGMDDYQEECLSTMGAYLKYGNSALPAPKILYLHRLYRRIGATQI